MLDITAEDCGVWISADEVRNYIEFSVRVIDLAASWGYPVENSWEADRAVLMANVADDDLLSKMDAIYYDAIDYLNADLYPYNLCFHVNRHGLFLTTRS
jgi:hypothetical protein